MHLLPKLESVLQIQPHPTRGHCCCVVMLQDVKQKQCCDLSGAARRQLPADMVHLTCPTRWSPFAWCSQCGTTCCRRRHPRSRAWQLQRSTGRSCRPGAAICRRSWRGQRRSIRLSMASTQPCRCGLAGLHACAHLALLIEHTRGQLALHTCACHAHYIHPCSWGRVWALQ